jgi:hypothetical protein
MKKNLTKKPRKFDVGNITISDYGKIILSPDEMLSFVSGDDKEYDFVAKDWGFYVTPSINGRLKKSGFKTALVKNNVNKIYIMAVEIDKISIFENYLINDNQIIICWLDEWFKS